MTSDGRRVCNDVGSIMANNSIRDIGRHSFTRYTFLEIMQVLNMYSFQTPLLNPIHLVNSHLEQNSIRNIGQEVFRYQKQLRFL